MKAVTARQRFLSMLFMLLCALLWSIGGVLVKAIPWNSFAIAGMRSLIAAGVIGGYMAVRRFRFLITRRTLAMMASIALTYLAFVTATKLTTAANAIVVQYTAPLFMLLYYGVFCKQRFCAADYLVVLFTVVGVAVCFLDELGRGGSAPGNIVALVSGLGFACMLITTGDAPEEERVSGLALGQALTALVGMPFFFAEGAPLTLQSSLCILALGVFQIGLAFIFYSLAARHCPPLACSLLSALEPLLNPVWVALFAAEVPGRLSLIGGAVVIAAITLWCVYNNRPERAASS